MKYVKMTAEQPDSWYTAQPLPHDLLEWHFTIKGPLHSDFEGGLFHGVIIFPDTYPFHAPQVLMLNDTGRFPKGIDLIPSLAGGQNGTYWSPALQLPSLIQTLASVFTDEDDCLPKVCSTPEERQRFAQASRGFKCSVCGQHGAQVEAELARGEVYEKAKNAETLALHLAAEARREQEQARPD